MEKILLGVAALVMVLVVVVAMRPNEFEVTRSIAVNAKPEAIFPHVNDLHQWDAWSPWAKLDPDAKVAFDGSDEGIGTWMSWDGNNDVGAGMMTITESDPFVRVVFRLEFSRPFAGVNAAEFTFKPEGDTTLVTWSMSGTHTFISKAVGLFMNCDKMVGDQFEQGLASLKAVVESPGE